MVMYKIDRRGGGSKNRILGQTPYLFQICTFFVKVRSLCHKLWFSNSDIFGFQYWRHLTFQTMTSVKSNNTRLRNIKGLRHRVQKIWGLESQNLWQGLNSFKRAHFNQPPPTSYSNNYKTVLKDEMWYFRWSHVGLLYCSVILIE